MGVCGSIRGYMKVIRLYAFEVRVGAYRADHVNLCAVFFEVMARSKSIEPRSAVKGVYGIPIAGFKEYLVDIAIWLPCVVLPLIYYAIDKSETCGARERKPITALFHKRG